MIIKEYPTQQVLELACAAQRVNGRYLKEQENKYADDGVLMYTEYSNRNLMLYTLSTRDVVPGVKALKVLPEDTAHAEEIKTYYKRLLFAAIDGENEFLVTINSILAAPTVKENQFGYVACLPSVQARDVAHNRVKKAVRFAEAGYLGSIGEQLLDLDAEIISSTKSKNFEGYNVDAIINSRMASWLSKVNLESGPCVIVKAKVKDHSKHWKHGTDVTRLNYVKAVQ
jgi:hypothetical protein